MLQCISLEKKLFQQGISLMKKNPALRSCFVSMCLRLVVAVPLLCMSQCDGNPSTSNPATSALVAPPIYSTAALYPCDGLEKTVDRTRGFTVVELANEGRNFFDCSMGVFTRRTTADGLEHCELVGCSGSTYALWVLYVEKKTSFETCITLGVDPRDLTLDGYHQYRVCLPPAK